MVFIGRKFGWHPRVVVSETLTSCWKGMTCTSGTHGQVSTTRTDAEVNVEGTGIGNARNEEIHACAVVL